MKSEDIARYVAGLEGEVERLVVELQHEKNWGHSQHVNMWHARAQRAEAQNEVERLRAAQPALPEVGPVTRNEHGLLTCGPEADWYCHITSPDRLRLFAARYLAVADHLDAEAAAADTTPDKRPCGSEGPDEPCDCDLDSSPLADAPDTSRVTFGARHEGTGMVLLQHADAVYENTVYGDDARDTADWHRSSSVVRKLDARSRSIHAALAEVREALNTAEADGVDVHYGVVLSGLSRNYADDPEDPIQHRAHRLLAREVQALVDQGLRGDDLNARVPYPVRDHRTPVENADTSSDDECICPNCREARNVLDAHRAARTSEGGAA